MNVPYIIFTSDEENKMLAFCQQPTVATCTLDVDYLHILNPFYNVYSSNKIIEPTCVHCAEVYLTNLNDNSVHVDHNTPNTGMENLE